MATMMECYPSQVFVDDEMKPLVSGRLTVYNHDTNVLANIYSLEGQDYVAMDNPVRLDEAGRLGASIFAELGVYDVKLEKYNGDGTFEDFDNYEMGIDARLDQVGRDSVKTIEDLKDLDPTVCTNVVTVESYPRRDYLWDPNAIDNEDGGVVIASDVSDHGRWLLLWDCPYLPSSVYGVYNGDVTNINALFNYASVIGSMNIHTPPCIRLETGYYDFGGYYICIKHLALEPNVQFSGTIGLYDDLELFGRAEPESNIGDFNFLHSGCSAHSCWFRDLNDFWHCGADILYVDNTNHFNSGATKLKQPVILSGKTVVGSDTKVDAYANSSYFQLALDSTVPDNFFIPNKDFVRIAGTGFGDSVFRTSGTWDPGLINQGHHVQFDLTPDLDLFENTQRWVSTMVERRSRLSYQIWNQGELDLQGRSCQTLRLETQGFTTVKNAIINETMLVGYSTTFINVTTQLSINSSIGAGITLQNCNITIPRNWTTGLNYISSTNSNINVVGPEGIDPCNCGLSIYGGTWSGYVKMSEAHRDAYALSYTVAFRNVMITGDFKWHVNQIYMVGCTSSCPIDLYPANGGDDVYYYNCTLHNNHFTGAFRLWLTMYYTMEHPHYEVVGTAVKFNTMVITDNRFDTTDPHGIKMLHVHPLSYNTYCCAAPQHYSMGTWQYIGNTGNCPRMTPGKLSARDNWAVEWHENYAHTSYRKSGSTHYVFMPYYYMHTDYTSDEPNRYKDPADPSQEAIAEYHNRLWGTSWSYAYFWTSMGASLTSEDDNNRLVGYVWMGRDKTVDHTPEWHVEGDTGDDQAYTAYTIFTLPSQYV